MRLTIKQKKEKLKEENNKSDINYFLKNIKDITGYSDRNYYLKLMKLYYTDQYIKTFITDEEFNKHFFKN